MKMKLHLIAITLIAMIMASSCSTPKDIAYIQNVDYGKTEVAVNLNEIKIQPHDQISIVVSCKEKELAELFNLVQSNKRVGTSQSSNGEMSLYTIDSNGDIDFPILGKIHVSGLNREQISQKIEVLLKEGKWVSDPIVTVEFANLHFSVIGEVKSPGTYPITNDKITLFEALSKAGDLTHFGVRDITVIREQGGERTAYKVDLKDSSLFNSPVYYLQQNDVIYVQPNDAIARQSSDNPNNLKSISLWTSIASFITTVIVLIVK